MEQGDVCVCVRLKPPLLPAHPPAAAAYITGQCLTIDGGMTMC